MNHTIDREQEHARLQADDARARAGRDLALIVVGAVAVIAILSVTGVLDRLRRWAGDLSGQGRGALLAALFLVPIGACAYAVRRYQDAKRTRQALYRLSYHDPLTGLPNRRFLGDGFDQMLKLTRRRNGRIAVLFVDLEGLEEVNHTYGPAFGDQLLVAVAARLVEAIGPDDRAVRYGGDQFVLFCPEVSTTLSAERIARSVLAFVETPFEVGDTQVRVSADIGVAITEERCTRPDEVLRDADAALHQAKQAGPGGCALFDRAMRDQITPSTAERRMRRALENGELRLYYQPMVSLWTKRLVGVEALLRWSDPSRGVIDTDEFMSALEDTALIVPIGTWIIQEVARQSKAWHDAFPDRPTLTVKVNVAERQLGQANFASQLCDVLERTGADPSWLYLEIAESVLMRDPDAIAATLADAREVGVKLALDHFGTGYSSLSHVRRLGLSMLTVDKSFVDGLGQSHEDTTIVEHVIGISKALGLVTVAEGVEDEQQIARLRDLNCDLAQGQFFSQPQPPYVITELLAHTGGDQEWQPPSKTGDEQAAPAVVVDRFDPATS
ncbi:MAG TPA: bifunctional diguanylate cyclase/phosphodiesterase [Acidimicrobiales bacterium]|nr:bifunctional diguanylate cyclase/phosphodiesterase [Acidimicrobiales bacterium]